ncbi:MAG TPA: MFS transporter [Firmicutes bacterium]|nr:MFS transporter [Bacillota bacterium]
MKLMNHVFFTQKDYRHFCIYRFIFGVAYSLMIPVIPLYFDHIGMSTVVIGTVMSLYGVSKTLVQMPFGIVSDTFGDKKTLLVSLALMIAVPLAYTFSQNPSIAAINYIVQGAILGMAAPATFSLLARTLDPKRRGESTGLASAVFTLGGGIGAAIGGFIVSTKGNYNMVFHIASFGILYTFIYVILQLPKIPTQKHAQKHKQKNSLGEMLEEIHRYKLGYKIFVLGSIAFLGDFIYGCVVALFHFYGQDVLGATTGYTSAIISVYLFVFGLGAPFAGWVSDKIGNNKQLFLSFAVMNATLLGLGLVRSIPLFTSIIVIYFLGATFLNAALQSSLSEFGGNDKIKGIVFGFVGAAESLGYALGPFICSYVYAFNPTLLFFSLLVVSSLISFIYLVFRKRANV